MIATLVITAAWLLAGASAAGGLYWLFLSTPESTIWTLAVSAVLLILMGVTVAVTLNAALLAWHRRAWTVGAIARGALGIPAFVPPLLLFAAIVWLSAAFVEWVSRNQGPISAVFIARLGWSDVTVLFTAAEWCGAWLQWVAAPFAALVWLDQILTDQWRPGWTLVRRGFSPTRLLAATAAFAMLAYAPWVYLVPWRPAWVPTDTFELVFIGAKLAFVAILAALGSSLIVGLAVRRPAKVEVT